MHNSKREHGASRLNSCTGNMQLAAACWCAAIANKETHHCSSYYTPRQPQSPRQPHNPQQQHPAMGLTCFAQLLPELLQLLPHLPLAACCVSQPLVFLCCHGAQLVQLSLQIAMLHLEAGKLCSGSKCATHSTTLQQHFCRRAICHQNSDAVSADIKCCLWAQVEACHADSQDNNASMAAETAYR